MIEVACHLSSKRFSCLTNGPKYAPPCQSYFSNQSMDKMITREYNHIIRSFQTALTKMCVSCSDNLKHVLLINQTFLYFFFLFQIISSYQKITHLTTISIPHLSPQTSTYGSHHDLTHTLKHTPIHSKQKLPNNHQKC